jgi:hypothetical protein
MVDFQMKKTVAHTDYVVDSNDLELFRVLDLGIGGGAS